MPAPATLYCAHQIITESVRSSAASLDRTAAGAARDDPSSRTMSPTVRETSTATSSVPPPAAVTFQNNEAHSGAPESSASPEPVLGDTAESRCSILATTHPGASPRPTSASERSTAEGSPKAGPHEDKDPPNTSSVNRAVQTNTAALPDCLSPILPLASNITAISSSQRGLDTEHAGDPSDSSRYDIV